MSGVYTAILTAVILVGASIPKPTIADDTDILKFSGILAAAPCSNHGDMEIGGEDTIVTPGQSVTCVATGGEIRIRNITVEEGGSFFVKAYEHTSLADEDSDMQWADTSCTSGILGSPDCNVCADNVRRQFDDLFGSRVRKSEGYWKLVQQKRYSPSNNRPEDAFSPGNILRHIQGFVKIDQGSYAGTYSNKEGSKGSIFFVNFDPANDRLHLEGLHEAWSHHPSGMSLLGNYVIFGDRRDNPSGRDLRVIRTSDARTFSRTSLSVKNWESNGETYKFGDGGGVGMAKLNSGGYLLISTHPGGPAMDKDFTDREFDTFNPDNPPKNTDFFYVEGKPNSSNTGLTEFGSVLREAGYLDMTTRHLGRWTQDQFGENAKQRKYQYSENLTVIPECGTGDIFVIHTSATKPWAVQLDEKPGYWRLSKVIWKSSGPALDILRVYEDDQSWAGCLHRAAATAWVNSNHEMELYCSEYRLSRREGDMHFKIRAIDHEAEL